MKISTSDEVILEVRNYYYNKFIKNYYTSILGGGETDLPPTAHTGKQVSPRRTACFPIFFSISFVEMKKPSGE